MQLKSIEIKGFKSFADRTVLNFNEKITGVVGPNGCGKSNVIDSIRWVLGEQKTSALRLEKMDNLIFNGTKKRAASGRAEVNITFENTRNLLPTEFNNINISRHLYRNGDSEYRLNGVPCRLKDIANLFMDTGISSDSYAIIELGMIDDILKDKENSRRKLFEQAAGILKYKVRKKETTTKLQATDADLERVQDLLSEIESNLKTLEKQAKRAEKYYKIKEQYKEAVIENTLHQLSHHKVQFEELQQNEVQQNDLLLQAQTEFTTLETALETQKVQLIDAEKQLADLQKNYNNHLNELKETENNKNLIAQNLKFLNEKNTSLQNQTQQATQSIEVLEQAVNTLQIQQQTENNTLQTIENEANELKKQLETVRDQHRQALQLLNSEQQKYQQIERQAFEVEKQIAIKNTQKENQQNEINNLQNRFNSLKNELFNLNSQLQKAETEKNSLTQKLTSTQSDTTDTKAQIEDYTQGIQQLTQQLNDLNRQLDAKRNEYKLTKSLVDSLEGFPDSIKYLKTNATQWADNQNSIPLLLDILNCEEAYKTALENYLNPYLNYYLAATPQQAFAALQLLQNNNKGKANFFVLSEIESTENLQPAPAIQPNNAIPALQILNVEKQYIPLLQTLLHQVFIINTENPNDELLQFTPHATFITQNGKVLRKKGTVSGGSVGSYEGKRIGKRQQVQLLEKEIPELEQKTRELQTEIKEYQQFITQLNAELKENQRHIETQKNAVTELNNRIMSVKLKIENAENFIDEGHTKQGNFEIKVSQITQDIQTLNEQNIQLLTQKNDYKQSLQNADNNFQNLARQLSKANHLFNEKNIDFHKQQNRLNATTQNYQFKNTQLSDTQNQLTQNQYTIAQNTQQIEENTTQLQTIDNELITKYNQKQVLETNLNETETNYYQQRHALAENENNLKQKNRNIQQIQAIITQIQNQNNELKFKLVSIKERLLLEFNIEIDSLLQTPPQPDFTPEQWADSVAKLKKQLDNYGEINPLAIEAYTEIKERYDFIILQKNDLVEAKKTLLETIKEIETKATQQFMNAFEQVRTHFISVFRSLFTPEDQCDLVLTEPLMPLESPIDIIAKPKGKRPQSINQLSGGEKSLTALALVFSLYLLKPAPFCILDEVDAPLDDTNVGKFIQLIRRFSDTSQFIIVTHNKNTMASADIIYGVTMEEQGVSKVVPVDFRTLTQ